MVAKRIDTPLSITTQAELAPHLESGLPILIYLWNGETLRSDVRTELDKMAKEHAGRLLVLKVDASREAALAERFSLGKHPVMIALVGQEVVTRRSRPWATDIPSVADVLLARAAELTPAIPEALAKAEPTAVAAAPKQEVIKNINKPITVTDATFEAEVVHNPLPVVVDFWADWCQPCKMVAPILDKLASEFAGQVVVAKVDVDANPGLQQYFQIMSIPTLMFIKGGTIVGQQAGALPEATLRDVFQQLVTLEVPPRQEEHAEPATEEKTTKPKGKKQ
jgi:thioredoxin 1